MEASKQAIELNHHALLGRFDALENQLQQAPKRGARLPHTLTVSLVTGTELRTYHSCYQTYLFSASMQEGSHEL